MSYLKIKVVVKTLLKKSILQMYVNRTGGQKTHAVTCYGRTIRKVRGGGVWCFCPHGLFYGSLGGHVFLSYFDIIIIFFLPLFGCTY
jgi:hypothetical protein